MVAKCATDSAGKDNVTVTANWCWDSFNNNLESFSFKNQQANTFFGGVYVNCSYHGIPVVDTRSGGVGGTTASETFHVTWCAVIKDYEPSTLTVHYWAHVVGGATNLDFAEIGTDGG